MKKGGFDMKPDVIMFPDASLRRSRKNPNITYAGYGVVFLHRKSGRYTTISGTLSKDSIVTCEAWAIYQGLRVLEKMRKNKQIPKHSNIVIFTDSKVNVEALTTWIRYNWDLSDYYNWTKRNKSIVKDQDIYRKILKILSKGHLEIRFVHINSHVKSQNDLDHIRKNLYEESIHIADSLVSCIIDFNDIADQLATKESRNLQSMYDKGIIINKLRRSKND